LRIEAVPSPPPKILEGTVPRCPPTPRPLQAVMATAVSVGEIGTEITIFFSFLEKCYASTVSMVKIKFDSYADIMFIYEHN